MQYVWADVCLCLNYVRATLSRCALVCMLPYVDM